MPGHKNKLIQMLFPSWASAVACAALASFLVAAVFVTFQYNGSQLQLIKTQAASEHTIDYDALDEDLTARNLLGDIPLFIFWGGVGFLAYTLTIALAGGLGNAMTFRKQLNYVHADRKKLIREAWQK